MPVDDVGALAEHFLAGQGTLAAAFERRQNRPLPVLGHVFDLRYHDRCIASPTFPDGRHRLVAAITSESGTLTARAAERIGAER